jgi:hypothetical protein
METSKKTFEEEDDDPAAAIAKRIRFFIHLKATESLLYRNGWCMLAANHGGLTSCNCCRSRQEENVLDIELHVVPVVVEGCAG